MQTNYYLGVVVAIENHKLLTKPKEAREIVVDIPGVVEGILAHPKSSDLDEPRVGDPVILECLDPVYKSYYTYYKLKENNFIGIRASGKAISITPEEITIGIYDKNAEFKDGELPKLTSKIVIDADGNIEICGGGKEITISEATIKTNGGLPDTSTGLGTGGFCGIITCPILNAPHLTSKIMGIK